MFTIVGLGNPGEEYKETRHNIGWLILELIRQKNNLPAFVRSSQFGGNISEGMLHGEDVGILFPTTFMNNSGTSVVKYMKGRGPLETLIVVHDDIDLAFGDVRISFDRGAGGHNGIRSIIDACGSKKFVRVRVGIAQKGFFGGVKRPKGDSLAAYVLTAFKKGELKTFEDTASRIDSALALILQKGVHSAMQEINGGV
jgi:PTH1 family peptidyl-tRNA hydrolase